MEVSASGCEIALTISVDRVVCRQETGVYGGSTGKARIVGGRHSENGAGTVAISFARYVLPFWAANRR